MVALGAILPFEVIRDEVTAGGMTFTDVKAAFYGLMVIAVLTLVRRVDRSYLREHRVPLGLFGALVLTCLVSSLAGADRMSGLKWSFDLALGGLLSFAVPFWLTERRAETMRWLGVALVAGAALGAAVGFLEFGLGMRFAESLTWFKTRPTVAGPYLRLSGTFDYANIAGAYFALALPFAAVGMAGSLVARGRRLRVLAWAVAGDALLVALLLTYSRGGIVAAAAGMLVMLIAARRYLPGKNLLRRWWPLPAAGCAGLVIGSIALSSTSLTTLRLTSQGDSGWYRAGYSGAVPAAVTACGRMTIPVRVQNRGPLTWNARGSQPYALSYHWLYPSSQAAVFEGSRTPLAANVPPGGTQLLRAGVLAPNRPGSYLFVWDMVQEGVTWFSAKSRTYRSVPVQVRKPGAGTASCAVPTLFARRPLLDTAPPQPGRLQLWRAAGAMLLAHPLLGVGPDGFRNRYGPFMQPPLHTWDRRIFANNLAVEVFADLGIAGGLLFFAFIISAIWPLVETAWRGQAALWQLPVAGALAAFLVHGVVDYTLWSHAVFILFWILCGVAAIRLRQAPAVEIGGSPYAHRD